MTNINHELNTLNEAVYLYPADDQRNEWCLPKDYPGYEPQVGQYVHVRKVAPGYIQRGLNMTVQNRRTPVTYQVIEVISAHDVEVTGGTGHWENQYVCRDLSIPGSNWTITVPGRRLVPAS